MISLDCETTGLDINHGAKPFMVQVCKENGEQQWWEWHVNPDTRKPDIPKRDLGQIQSMILDADYIVLQNPKFDVAALQSAFGIYGLELDWDWSKTYDTLLAGHLLGSNEPHDLTSMALLYLDVNVQPFEDAIKKATKEARRMCQSKDSKYSDWRIAKAGLPEMPSAKGEVWKNDMWLPRAMVRYEDHPDVRTDKHPWNTVCSDYGNSDSEVTLALFLRQRELLKERGLWKIYKERLKILPIVYAMQEKGITINRRRLEELQTEYLAESQKAGRICTNIAESYGYNLKLPRGSNNNSLKNFVFGEDGLHLEPVSRSKKTGAPSLDKACMEEYLASLPKRSKALKFIETLIGKRRRDTALSYMNGYEKFWLPLEVGQTEGYTRIICGKEAEWYVLHPSLNPTGTHTLRWSSQNPNEQNISKQEGFNLRYCFGPAPGREWWSLDAQNIELRIPAYEAGETEMIKLFERPDDPPYFGSNHLLVFDILHTKRLKLDTRDPKYLLKAKKKYTSTWYSWTKNGNFAVQYGAVEHSGTADRAYHVEGAQHDIEGRFKKVKLLNERMIAFANEHGYVETMPDKTVDPERGYPLLCTRTHYGRILPTVPLNYFVSGTAMQWMMKAMIRVQEYLDEQNERLRESARSYMIMQVHDELVFDFPRGRELSGSPGPQYRNLSKIRKIQRLMEQGGDDIGIPTPVSIEYHGDNWSEGISV